MYNHDAERRQRDAARTPEKSSGSKFKFSIAVTRQPQRCPGLIRAGGFRYRRRLLARDRSSRCLTSCLVESFPSEQRCLRLSDSESRAGSRGPGRRRLGSLDQSVGPHWTPRLIAARPAPQAGSLAGASCKVRPSQRHQPALRQYPSLRVTFVDFDNGNRQPDSTGELNGIVPPFDRIFSTPTLKRFLKGYDLGFRAEISG